MAGFGYNSPCLFIVVQLSISVFPTCHWYLDCFTADVVPFSQFVCCFFFFFIPLKLYTIFGAELKDEIAHFCNLVRYLFRPFLIKERMLIDSINVIVWFQMLGKCLISIYSHPCCECYNEFRVFECGAAENHGGQTAPENSVIKCVQSTIYLMFFRTLVIL